MSEALAGVCEWLGALAVEGARVVLIGHMHGHGVGHGVGHGEGEGDRRVATLLQRKGAGEVVEAPQSAPAALESTLGVGRADVIVVERLDRATDPLALLVASRRALRREGFLVVETASLPGEGQARVELVPLGPDALAWRPSKRALEGMLQLVGFEVVGTIAAGGHLSSLGRARRPSEIEQRAGRVQLVHEQYMRCANYRERIDFDALEADVGEPSTVRFLGRSGQG